MTATSIKNYPDFQSNPGADEIDNDRETSSPIKLVEEAAESGCKYHYDSDYEDRPTLQKTIYPGRHPLDNRTQDLYQKELKGLLEWPELINRLSYLPPDDGREMLLCTEEIFLSQVSEPLIRRMTRPSIPEAGQVCKKLLDHLATAPDTIRLGDTSKTVFWIRDYDRKGNYVEWDCVSPFQVRDKEIMLLPAGSWGFFCRPVATWTTETPVVSSGESGTTDSTDNAGSRFIAPWDRLMRVNYRG